MTFLEQTIFTKDQTVASRVSSKLTSKKNDPALIAINTIVNDVFAWRNGPNSLSITIKKYIDTLADEGKSDTEIYQECLIVFDLLHAVNKGTSADMHPLGKKETSHIPAQLFQSIYPANSQQLISAMEALNKVPKTQPFNAKLVHSIITKHQPTNDTESLLYPLALRILEKSKP